MPGDLLSMLSDEAREFVDAVVCSVEITPAEPPLDLYSAVKGAFGLKTALPPTLTPPPPGGTAAPGLAGSAKPVPAPAVFAPAPVQVESQNVQSFDLLLTVAGFEGFVRFVLVNDLPAGGPDSDLLAPLFHQDGMLKITLRMKPQFPAGLAAGKSGPGGVAGGLGGLGSKVGTEPPGLQLTGIITERAFFEQISEQASGEPILARVYSVRFSDPARALWSQHFPAELHTKVSLKSVIEKHRGQFVRVDYHDPALLKPEEMLCFGLDPYAPAGERCSFYDFVMWALDNRHARWLYDYVSGGYHIVGPPLALVAMYTGLMKRALSAMKILPPLPTLPSKPGGAPTPQPATQATGAASPARAKGGTSLPPGALPPAPGSVLTEKMLYVVDTADLLMKGSPAGKSVPTVGGAVSGLGGKMVSVGPPPIALTPKEVSRITICLPEFARYQPHLMNSYANNPVRFLIYNKYSAVGMRKDILLRTQLIKEFEKRVLLEMERFHPRQPEFIVHHRAFPTKPYTPGGQVDFNTDPVGWTTENLAVPVAAKKEPCRVFQLCLRGESLETDLKSFMGSKDPAHFRMQMTALLESGSNSRLRMPDYIPPRYPIAVEGIITSEVTEDPQLAEKTRLAAEAAALKRLSGTQYASAQSAAKGAAPAAAPSAGASGGTPGASPAMGQTAAPPPAPPVAKVLPGPAYQLFMSPVSLDHQYRVKIPLWSSQIVLATHAPIPVSSGYYQPLQSGERVLVELGFNEANIRGVLDYREGVKMPQESQGNQMVLGKGPNSGTMLRHSYQDGKPMFELGLSHMGSSQSLAFAPGKFALTVGPAMKAPAVPAPAPAAPAPAAPAAPPVAGPGGERGTP